MGGGVASVARREATLRDAVRRVTLGRAGNERIKHANERVSVTQRDVRAPRLRNGDKVLRDFVFQVILGWVILVLDTSSSPYAKLIACNESVLKLISFCSAVFKECNVKYTHDRRLLIMNDYRRIQH